MKRELVHKARRVVVKIGSGVISDPTGLEEGMVSLLSRQFCDQLAAGRELVLVSSGAVAAGKGFLGIQGRPPTIPLKQAAAAIGQSHLMRAYREAFAQDDRVVAQVLLTRDDLTHRRRYLNARNTLMTLLEHTVTPVINENDTVVVEEIRFGDNDNLSAMVTNLVEADLLVILSDVDGLYDRDPVRDRLARRIPQVDEVTAEVEALAGGTVTLLGTGGMATKVQAAKTAAAHGVGTVILNGRSPEILQRLFAGEDVGTFFAPRPERLTSKKHWIAFSTHPRGRLYLDAGACRAVRERHTSLLPSGIKRFEGEFERGDAVRLCDLEGREFARGIIGYTHLELGRIAGRNSAEIEELLGYKYGDEIVHRDNLVLKA